MPECEWQDRALSCPYQAHWILDCDECKNAYACWMHLSNMIGQHYQACGKTLHVDGLEKREQ